MDHDENLLTAAGLVTLVVLSLLPVATALPGPGLPHAAVGQHSIVRHPVQAGQPWPMASAAPVQSPGAIVRVAPVFPPTRGLGDPGVRIATVPVLGLPAVPRAVAPACPPGARPLALWTGEGLAWVPCSPRRTPVLQYVHPFVRLPVRPGPANGGGYRSASGAMPRPGSQWP